MNIYMYSTFEHVLLFTAINYSRQTVKWSNDDDHVLELRMDVCFMCALLNCIQKQKL